MAFALPLPFQHRNQHRREVGKQSKSAGLPSVTAWFPVRDIDNDILLLRDGRMAAGLELRPPGLSLRSQQEQERLVEAVFRALNGIRHPVQFLSLYRPVDLDAYLASLRDLLQDPGLSPVRRRWLQTYLRTAAAYAAGGEATERRHYALIPHSGPDTPAHRAELREQARHLADNLRAAGIPCEAVDAAGWRDLLWLWGHPHLAAVERPPEWPSLPTPVYARSGP